MKHILITFIVFCSVSISGISQTKKADPDHTNYYKPVTVVLPAIKIDVLDVVSKIDYVKFKIKLINTTNDYILYKPQESNFIIEGNEYKPEDKKPVLIQPLDNASRTIDAKGNGSNLHTDNFSFNLDGLYKVVPTGTVNAPNFILPPSVNQFVAGDFTVEMISISKKTQETAVKFKVTYTGEGMGIVDPKKLGVKIESGQIFANEKRDKSIVLGKGESDTFIALFHIEGKIADMQFANMEIVWNDTFKHAELKKIDGTTLNLVLDPGLTAGKNK
ncbi:MAG TPA: hypothetical protein VK796_10950 [Cytophaga sp.]|nr:hypothetical protein [Cytophaga sp.]